MKITHLIIIGLVHLLIAGTGESFVVGPTCKCRGLTCATPCNAVGCPSSCDCGFDSSCELFCRNADCQACCSCAQSCDVEEEDMDVTLIDTKTFVHNVDDFPDWWRDDRTKLVEVLTEVNDTNWIKNSTGHYIRRPHRHQFLFFRTQDT